MDRNKQKVTGIILAGGKSSRMGSEKGLIKMNGKTFVEHIGNTLNTFADEVLISANNEEYRRFGYKFVEDISKDEGPLAGIEASLKISANELNLIIPCDMPIVCSSLLQDMIVYGSMAEYHTVTLKKGFPFPLLVKRTLITDISKALQKGQRSIIRFLSSVNSLYVMEIKEDVQLPQSYNTPEDIIKAGLTIKYG